MKYTVQEGDSLYRISKKFYGEGFLWDMIYRENKAIIGNNPDLIFAGQVLTIPSNIFLKNKFRSD